MLLAKPQASKRRGGPLSSAGCRQGLILRPRRNPVSAHEPTPAPSNTLGLDGIEFIEYATSQPQEFGALLQKMGFSLVARHRSRDVLLYRQGSMNLIVNAHPDALPGLSSPGRKVPAARPGAH